MIDFDPFDIASQQARENDRRLELTPAQFQALVGLLDVVKVAAAKKEERE